MPTYEAEIYAPLFNSTYENNHLEPEADFTLEQIRNLATPVIIARFEDMSFTDAASRWEDINMELRSRGLSPLGDLRLNRRKK